MAEHAIPEDIKQFILQHIDSIAHLEGLLMFHGNPQKEWNAEAIGHALYINPEQAAALLAKLYEQGFITSGSAPSHYRYDPKLPASGAMIGHIAGVYRQYLVPVTNLIHSKSKSRVREFADAFKIRKD